MITEQQYKDAIQKIDIIHQEDPNLELYQGVEVKAEWLYSERMLEVLAKVAPEASLELKLAAKCQHMHRWGIPRNTFTIDKKGYYQWRAAVMEHQLGYTVGVLEDAGIAATSIDVVVDALKNKADKTNVHAAIIEDTACLVFIKWYLVDFAGQFEVEKAKTILAKTAKKMTAHGLSLLSQLNLAPAVLDILKLLED